MLTSCPIKAQSHPTPMLPPRSHLACCVEAGMLGVEVGVGTGCRLEGHGADGALVETSVSVTSGCGT